MNPIRAALSAACALLMAGCGLDQERQARGGGLEGETLTLTGRAVYADGSPAASAEVRVRSSDATDTAMISEGLVATTDADGRYRVTGVQAGDYFVITETPNAQASFQEVHVAPPDPAVPIVSILPDTVKPKGAIRVRVLPSAGSALPAGMVQLPGLGSQALIDTAGSALIPVPPGIYFVRIVYPALGLMHRVNLAVVKAGDTLNLGPFTLNPPGPEAMPEWKHSKTLRLNTGAQGAATADPVFGFPVLIRLDSSNFPFDQLGERHDGSDIRFTDADGKPLPFEIENWDGPGRKGQIWVGLDTVYGNRADQYINILYGKSDVFSTASPNGVFDTADGTNAAWHFAMYNPAGLLSDATVNGNRLRSGTTQKETGVAGFAWTLAPGDELGAAASASQEPASLSLEAWFRPKGAQALSRLIWKHRRGEAAAAYSITWLGNESVLEFTLADGSAATGSVSLRAPVPATRDWIHFVATFDAKTGVAALYINGKPAAKLANLGPIDYRSAGDLMIGSQPGGLNGFKGALDEVRLYRKALSPSRAALEYANQRPGATWVEFPPL
ncbi:MAG: biopolymer transporter ExbB [Fibrobacteres bacterium]|nr:biopolymer transporter ExbB [Fibrobacterota bacterium]